MQHDRLCPQHNDPIHNKPIPSGNQTWLAASWKSHMNGSFHSKITYRWSIFLGYVWLLEGQASTHDLTWSAMIWYQLMSCGSPGVEAQLLRLVDRPVHDPQEKTKRFLRICWRVRNINPLYNWCSFDVNTCIYFIYIYIYIRICIMDIWVSIYLYIYTYICSISAFWI